MRRAAKPSLLGGTDRRLERLNFGGDEELIPEDVGAGNTGGSGVGVAGGVNFGCHA